MPKSLTATGLRLENLNVAEDGTGTVTGLNASVNIDYGLTSSREQFDVWVNLTATQRSNFQTLYNVLTQSLQDAYLV